MFTKLRMVSAVFGLFILLAVVGVTLAAELCIPINTALAVATVGDKCDAIGSNQACYGNMRVRAKDHNGAEIAAFSQPGALANVADMGELYHYPLDAQNLAIWGITRMNLSMGMPVDSDFIAFGEVLIKQEIPTPTMTTNLTAAILPNSAGYPIVRNAPDQSAAQAYDEGIPDGTIVAVLSRTENNEWALVRYEDTNETQADGSVKTQVVYGWVRLTRLDIDPALIPVQPAATNPMQAFNLALSDTAMFDTCDGVPQSGVLIQSAEGNPITLKVNGVWVYIGSTALLQPKADGSLRIINLDGAVAVRDSRNLIINIQVGHYIDVANDIFVTTTTVQIGYYDGKGVHILLEFLSVKIVMPLPIGQEAILVWQCDVDQNGVGGKWRASPNQPIILAHSYSDTLENMQNAGLRASEVYFNNIRIPRWSVTSLYPASPPSEPVKNPDTGATEHETKPSILGAEYYGLTEYFIIPPQAIGSFETEVRFSTEISFLCTIIVQETVSQPNSQPIPRSYTITLNPQVLWQTTPVKLLQGNTFSVTVTGDTNTCPIVCPGNPNFDANGAAITCPYVPLNQNTCVVDGVPYGRLVGRIGNQIFDIGGGGTFSASVDGILDLTINDNLDSFSDNIGQLIVTITVGA